MKDRIKLIMEKENLTSAKFADRLDINRAVISHILNGRNNPSLDVVTKILNEMNYINPEWLINGKGNMYKEGFDAISIPKEPDLFSQPTEIPDEGMQKAVKAQETELNSLVNEVQASDNKRIEVVKMNDKKITQIIIYYNDNTYQRFNP